MDMPNAFIQTRIEDEKGMVLMKIRGTLVDMLMDIAPDACGPHATTDKKGTKQLLVQCQNAICGAMAASLLHCRKFHTSLTGKGFDFNPCGDPCVANKIIKKKQMTIAFHVDDCKLSHENPKQMDSMISWFREECESVFEDGSGKMAVSRGKVHVHLGMTLNFTTKGQVKISMFPHVEEMSEAFDKAKPSEAGAKTSAAPANLFKINEDCEKPDETKAEAFHNLVAKTLHASKRARPDTCTAVAFLTARVREPDTDDWAKLTHMMKHIRGTKKLPLILSASGSGMLKWWIDASFAAHRRNMRGHTGGGLSVGRGFPIVNSAKQKLNTRSSTETEIAGVDGCMPAVLWTRCFMEAQGRGIRENIAFQDNKSAILMEKNGKASSSKRTKHFDVRCYFVTDRINKKDLTVEWCPTGDMISDCMTKPNQGALFIKFRDQIMGVTPAKDPGPGKAKRDSFFFNNSLVQQDRKSKLAHRSVLDGDRRTDRVNKLGTERVHRQQGAKKNTHT
jgi:hypothetical protein